MRVQLAHDLMDVHACSVAMCLSRSNRHVLFHSMDLLFYQGEITYAADHTLGVTGRRRCLPPAPSSTPPDQRATEMTINTAASQSPPIGPTHLDPARAADYVRTGAWADRHLDDLLRKQVRERPTQTVIIDGETHLDFATLDRMVDALAAWLSDRGVGRGDVVSFMLPNWWEGIVAQYAIVRIGAVINPLHMIYRQSELVFVFDQCRPKVVIGLGRFRTTDYGEILREACDLAASKPRLLGVRTGDGELEEILDSAAGVPAGILNDPDDVALLLYTSGTTSSPKGVLHSHNTLMRATADLRDLFTFVPDDRLFMPTPITHVSGLLYSMTMS